MESIAQTAKNILILCEQLASSADEHPIDDSRLRSAIFRLSGFNIEFEFSTGEVEDLNSLESEISESCRNTLYSIGNQSVPYSVGWDDDFEAFEAEAWRISTSQARSPFYQQVRDQIILIALTQRLCCFTIYYYTDKDQLPDDLQLILDALGATAQMSVAPVNKATAYETANYIFNRRSRMQADTSDRVESCLLAMEFAHRAFMARPNPRYAKYAAQNALLVSDYTDVRAQRRLAQSLFLDGYCCFHLRKVADHSQQLLEFCEGTVSCSEESVQEWQEMPSLESDPNFYADYTTRTQNEHGISQGLTLDLIAGIILYRQMSKLYIDENLAEFSSIVAASVTPSDYVINSVRFAINPMYWLWRLLLTLGERGYRKRPDDTILGDLAPRPGWDPPSTEACEHVDGLVTTFTGVFSRENPDQPIIALPNCAREIFGVSIPVAREKLGSEFGDWAHNQGKYLFHGSGLHQLNN